MYGVILHTENGGDSWSRQYISGGGTPWLGSIFFTDASNGWCVGENGTILHSDNGGFPVGIANEISIPDLRLENYPNPFSKKTTINFWIPRKTIIKISIYNQYGEIVFSQINPENSAGLSQLDFFSENLLSGVYYCLLETDLGVVSKKMILIK